MAMVVKIKGKEYKLEKAMDVILYSDYKNIDKNDLLYLVYQDTFIRGFLVITGKKQGKFVLCRPTCISLQNSLKRSLLEHVPIENLNILKKYGKIQKLWDFMTNTIIVTSFILTTLCFMFVFMWTINYDSIIAAPICGCIGLCCAVLIPLNCCELYNKELHFVHKA